MGKYKKIPGNANGLLLRWKELLAMVLLLLLLLWGVLPLWHNACLKVEVADGFRFGYAYRDDYLLYRVMSEAACAKYQELFLGDSVIWGMYVRNDSTLPAFLNARAGSEKYGNIAVDGLHPVAMETLIRNYGTGIRNRKIYLYLNPLWMNTPLYDLTGQGSMTINHPRLLPQFDFSIRSHEASLQDRCNATLERKLDFYAMLHHIRVCFFDNKDFKSWIARHPGENPFSRIKIELAPIETGHSANSTISWEEGGIPEQDWPWVKLADSRQWAAFQEVISLLQKRGNEVVVLVGSINPYLQSPASRERCEALRAAAMADLETRQVKAILLPLLPSAEYGDASHPLAPGYRRLADFLADKL